jgi:hypothetical protein
MHEHGGYEVEFMTLDGETVVVVSLSPDQVRPVGHWEIAHARLVTTEWFSRLVAHDHRRYVESEAK